MRFVAAEDAGAPSALVMREVMLPVCSPGYRRDRGGGRRQHLHPPERRPRRLAGPLPAVRDRTAGPAQDDRLLGLCAGRAGGPARQGIAFGWITVVAHALIAARWCRPPTRLTRGARVCELMAAAQPPGAPGRRGDPGLDRGRTARRHRDDRPAPPRPGTDGGQLLTRPPADQPVRGDVTHHPHPGAQRVAGEIGERQVLDIDDRDGRGIGPGRDGGRDRLVPARAIASSRDRSRKMRSTSPLTWAMAAPTALATDPCPTFTTR
jgi:hypothetical protein